MYDFDNIVNRRNNQEVKWDCLESELPMWIADMDFKCAPEIVEALKDRLDRPSFGYTDCYDDFYNAYISFWKDNYNFEIQRDWMFFATGVIPIVSSTVRKLTKEGDKVLVLTPIYNTFFNSIVNNDRIPFECEMDYDGKEYSIDYDKLERMLKDEKCTLMILCNPHNPLSRIWNKEELEKIGRLAYLNHVVVLSDEIHSPLTRPGVEYIPFASVNEINKNNCVMAISVTKAFSIPGLMTSLCVIPNKELFKKVNRQLNTDECAEPSTFATVSAIAALNKSRTWLKECRKYIFDNRDFVSKYIKENIPSLYVLKGDATYLLWIDISKVSDDSISFADYLRKKTGLYLCDGKRYRGNGNIFLRMNVATSRELLLDALNRLKDGVDLYLKENK